jgi:paraquat-inducible protein A
VVSENRTTEEVLQLPPSAARRLWWLLVLASLLLAVGLTAPILTISQFILIKDSFSVVSGVYELLKNGNLLLFVVVAGFSIVLPLLKIWVLFRLLRNNGTDSPAMARYLHLMHDYGRWSMLDVLVVAVLVVVVKLGTIASIEIHYGLSVFGAAVLLIMFITHRLVKLMGNSKT